ncbi:MAG TPA: K(+)-transporting ATPase subunit C, partial [Tepidisphaeraceae bacterium]|nr:K(+)-transporting ATPase subunit C [Tepidisphaeraceae bacterium]
MKSNIVKDLWASIAATVVLTIVCCGVYPLIVWGLSQAIFPGKANGSLVSKDGSITTVEADAVGSSLLGQNFSAPQYFHPRPSAAGNGYDASNSSGTNLGPLSDKLINGIHGSKNPDGTPNPSADFDGVKDLVAQYRKENNLSDTTLIPGDAVTRSGSGLDPHISLQNAQLQKNRIGQARGITSEQVQALIDSHTDGPDLGILGDPGVNVLALNLALDA